MKNIIYLFIVAIFSSMVTVGLIKILDQPEKLIHRASFSGSGSPMSASYKSQMRPLYMGSAPVDFVSAARIATPSVVFVKTLNGTGGQSWRYNYSSSSGSGVIISHDGYIVTNLHVIEDSKDIQVILNNKREYEATLVGSDPATDLALLKIDAEALPFLPFGDSDSVFVGEWVIAIGNPFRLESTVTAGIVSAKSRNINILEERTSIESFIQTDAVVNQGNSGGALVNIYGELIGINAAIITQSGKYEGYSFAIPSNLAIKVIDDLMEYGRVRRGLLGVNIRNVTSEMAEKLRLNSVKGVYIERVSRNSAADKAGLREGDVIISINDRETRTFPQLQELVAQYRPGDRLDLQYIRSQEVHEARVILQANEEQPAHEMTFMKIGFELRNLSSAEADEYGTEGVRVHSIYKNSLISSTNMELDYVITSVNGQSIKTVDDLATSLEQLNQKLVEFGGFYPFHQGDYFYTFTLE